MKIIVVVVVALVIAVRSFAGTIFRASSTCTQERSGTDDHELPYGKLQAGNWINQKRETSE